VNTAQVNRLVTLLEFLMPDGPKSGVVGLWAKESTTIVDATGTQSPPTTTAGSSQTPPVGSNTETSTTTTAAASAQSSPTTTAGTSQAPPGSTGDTAPSTAIARLAPPSIQQVMSLAGAVLRVLRPYWWRTYGEHEWTYKYQLQLHLTSFAGEKFVQFALEEDGLVLDPETTFVTTNHTRTITVKKYLFRQMSNRISKMHAVYKGLVKIVLTKIFTDEATTIRMQPYQAHGNESMTNKDLVLRFATTQVVAQLTKEARVLLISEMVTAAVLKVRDEALVVFRKRFFNQTARWRSLQLLHYRAVIEFLRELLFKPVGIPEVKAEQQYAVNPGATEMKDGVWSGGSETPEKRLAAIMYGKADTHALVSLRTGKLPNQSPLPSPSPAESPNNASSVPSPEASPASPSAHASPASPSHDSPPES